MSTEEAGAQVLPSAIAEPSSLDARGNRALVVVAFWDFGGNAQNKLNGSEKRARELSLDHIIARALQVPHVPSTCLPVCH